MTAKLHAVPEGGAATGAGGVTGVIRLVLDLPHPKATINRHSIPHDPIFRRPTVNLLETSGLTSIPAKRSSGGGFRKEAWVFCSALKEDSTRL
jgi:hypothetical protein